MARRKDRPASILFWGQQVCKCSFHCQPNVSLESHLMINISLGFGSILVCTYAGHAHCSETMSIQMEIIPLANHTTKTVGMWGNKILNVLFLPQTVLPEILGRIDRTVVLPEILGRFDRSPYRTTLVTMLCHLVVQIQRAIISLALLWDNLKVTISILRNIP